MDKKKPDRRERMSDGLMVSGAALVSVGIGMLSVAAGIIAAGVLAMVYGVLIARGGEKA